MEILNIIPITAVLGYFVYIIVSFIMKDKRKSIDDPPFLETKPYNCESGIPIFKLFIGPMFAGKTTSMFTEVLKYSYKKKSKIFKMKMDNRNNGSKIVVHNQQIQLDSEIVDKPEDILKYDLDVYGIDELQFFTNKEGEKSIKIVIQELLIKGKIIIASGLSGKSNEDQWPIISECIPLGEIKYVKGLCSKCHGPSTRSGLVVDNKLEKKTSIIKSTNIGFIPLCCKCFYEN